MTLLHHIVISLSVLLLIITHSNAFDVEAEFCYSSMSSTGHTKSNINQLLANLVPSFEQGAIFVETSYGKSKNKVYGLAQCRGLADTKTCLGCIHDAAQEVPNLCVNQPEVTTWYDFCYVRYGLNQFYGTVDTSSNNYIGNPMNVTDVNALSKTLGKLFNLLKSEAVRPQNGGFAKRTTDLSEFETVYGAAECTKDLSSASCAQCLDAAVKNFDGYCSGMKGCRVFYINCNVRYELYPFFKS